MRVSHLLVATAALLSGLSCAEEASGPRDGAPGLPPMADRTVRATVVMQRLADGAFEARVRIDTKDIELGAYQGRFRFDPEALTLEAASVPEGEYRVVNDARAAEGELRFAGFTVRGFETPDALVMRFRSSGPVNPDDVSVELEVVGTLGGNPVPAERILPPAKLF